MLSLFLAAFIYSGMTFEEYEATKIDIAQTYITDEYDYADIVHVIVDGEINSVRLVLWARDQQGIHRPYVCYTHYVKFGHVLGCPIALDENTIQVYDQSMPMSINQSEWYLVGIFRQFKVKEIRYWEFPLSKWKHPSSGIVVAGNFPPIPRDEFIWTKEHAKLYKNREI